MKTAARIMRWLAGGLLLAPWIVMAPGGPPPPAAPGSGDDPHELLVRFAPHATAKIQTATHRAHGAYRKRTGRRGDWEVVALPPYADRAAAMREYRNDPHVAYVEPNRRVWLASGGAAALTPDDPYYSDQWGLPRIGMSAVWDSMGTAGDAAGIVVAVLDTGIDRDHPDLQDNIWAGWGWNFVAGNDQPADDNDHGTHVAGIIGAVGNNGTGVAGVAWNVDLMAVKVLDHTGSGYLSDIIDGIGYAVDEGAHIINASLEWRRALDAGPLPTACTDFAGNGQLLCEEIEAAGNQGVLVVAAAGNSGDSNESGKVSLPASYPLSNVISVAASTRRYSGADSDRLAWFSNYGRRTVHLAAPGVDIASTLPGNQYGTISGTSMAAPLVAGVTALLLAEDGGGAPLLTRERLLGTVACDSEGGGEDRPCASAPLGSGAGDELNRDTLAGGRLDAEAAWATAAGSIPPVPPSHLGVRWDGGIVRLTWAPSRPSATGYRVQRRSSGGAFVTIGDVADGGAGSFDDTGVGEVEEAEYIVYRVRAENGGGLYSRWAEAALDLPAPTGLAAKTDGLTVRLSWDDYPLTLSALEFQLRRRAEGRSTEVTRVRGDATTHRDTVEDPDRYTYDLRACLNGECSSWSASVTRGVYGTGAAAFVDHFDGFDQASAESRCFIATAAYGSPWEEEVAALRAFRDDYLMTHAPGRAVVAAYYALSPPLARWIAADERRRAAARMVLAPVAALAARWNAGADSGERGEAVAYGNR